MICSLGCSAPQTVVDAAVTLLDSQERASPDKLVSMKKIEHSDLSVYELCLGTNTFGWTSSPEQSFAVLDAYVGGGGNFLDTADVYSAWADGNVGGESEKVIGEWLSKQKGRRDEVVIATKIGKLSPYDGQSPTNVRRAVEDSLRRLRTDHIDLLYAHAEDPKNPTDPAVFAQLAQEGKIRYWGLSNHRPNVVEEVLEAAAEQGVPTPVALQPHYNLAFRKEYEDGLRKVAESFSLSVFPYFSLASGLLTGKYDLGESLSGHRASMVEPYLQEGTPKLLSTLKKVADELNVEPASVAIAWLLAQPTVTAPIASARTAEQLPALLEGTTLTLTPDQLAALNEASA